MYGVTDIFNIIISITFFNTSLIKQGIVLGPTQPPIKWVSRALPLGVKRSEHEVDHSPSSAEVKEWVELRLHTLNKPSWRDAQLKKAQGQLYFYLYILRLSVECRRIWKEMIMAFLKVASPEGLRKTAKNTLPLGRDENRSLKQWIAMFSRLNQTT